MSRRAAYVLIGIFAVGIWIGVAEYFHLSLYTLVVGSVVGALACLLVLVILPRWRQRRCLSEYHALLDNDQGKSPAKRVTGIAGSFISTMAVLRAKPGGG
jgi:membrane protein YdbS with pleckstrin-like domain